MEQSNRIKAKENQIQSKLEKLESEFELFNESFRKRMKFLDFVQKKLVQHKINFVIK